MLERDSCGIKKVVCQGQGEEWLCSVKATYFTVLPYSIKLQTHKAGMPKHKGSVMETAGE